MDNNILNISGIVKESIVDGPGIRYVIFTQGCPHKCRDCHNPQTHNLHFGTSINIDEIVNDINKNPLLKGVTISGGEPFIQADKVSKLIAKLDTNKLDVIVYTGYDFEYLINSSNDKNNFISLIQSSDILIDGKFDISLKSDLLPFRGSTNQRSINSKESLKTGQIILHNFQSEV